MHPYRPVLSALPVLLVLTGCEAQPAKPDTPPAPYASRQPEPAPGADVPVPAETPSLGTVETLAGEWRVAGIDDAPLDESYGIALSANESVLWWDPRCAQRARDYAIDGRSIAFSPIDRAGSTTKAPPCLPGLPARLADVERALDAATAIGRTPSNGILISGGGHSVLLFSQ